MPTYIDPTADEDQAELLGRLAALRGERIAANPFDDGTRELWLACDSGWRDEHRRMGDALRRLLRKSQV